MLRKLFIPCLILSTFVIAGCGGEKPKPHGIRVAIIEGQAVFEKSKIAMDGVAYAEELAAKLSVRRDEMMVKFSEAPDDTALQSSLQEEYMELQLAIETVQRGVGEKIYKLFEQTVADYRKANNIEVVLHKEVVISFDEKADITAIIAELMDRSGLNPRDEPLPAVLNPPAGKPGAAIQDKPEEQDRAEAPKP